MTDRTIEINGWTIYAHPLFLDQLEALIAAVEKARAKDPKGYKKKRAAKLLAAILKVAFENIPADPAGDVFRQGDTLGADYKHWFRANFFFTVSAVLSLSADGHKQGYHPRLGERRRNVARLWQHDGCLRRVPEDAEPRKSTEQLARIAACRRQT